MLGAAVGEALKIAYIYITKVTKGIPGMWEQNRRELCMCIGKQNTMELKMKWNYGQFCVFLYLVVESWIFFLLKSDFPICIFNNSQQEFWHLISQLHHEWILNNDDGHSKSNPNVVLTFVKVKQYWLNDAFRFLYFW